MFVVAPEQTAPADAARRNAVNLLGAQIDRDCREQFRRSVGDIFAPGECCRSRRQAWFLARTFWARGRPAPLGANIILSRPWRATMGAYTSLAQQIATHSHLSSPAEFKLNALARDGSKFSPASFAAASESAEAA